MKLIDAKTARFQKSARLLTGEMGIQMLIEKNPQGAPASYNLDSREMVLNDAVPKIKGDKVKALAFDRAKLFHECGHVKWTRDASGLRGELAKKSRNSQAFLDVSNILEDGRIEWLMSHRWHGAAAYLKLLFGHFLGEVLGDERADNLNGLAFYVRALKWRNAREAGFWKPVVREIGKGIRAKSTHEVCRIAFEIVEKLFPAADKPQGDAQGNAQGGEGKGEPTKDAPETGKPQGGDSGDSGEASSEASEDDSEASGDSEGAEDDAEDAEDSESGGEGADGEDSESANNGGGSGGDSDEDGGEESTQPAQGSEGEEKDGISEDVRKAVEAAMKETLKAVKEEVAEELQEIEALMDAPEAQQFEGGEESEAEAVSHILASIQTERQRSSYLPSRKSGRIDARRIVGVVSGDSFLTRRQEANGPINVAFCIDRSASMGAYVGDGKNRMDVATSCARIINGALQKARINSVGIAFGGHGEAKRYPNIGLGSIQYGGGTPTEKGMEMARLWLSEQQPEGGKGIILIVTDGQPNSVSLCEEEFRKANEAGYVVVCVGICAKPYGKYFHDSGTVENPKDLARMLEDKLIGAMEMV